MQSYYAPDTNFFLQCRNPKELPWVEITPAAEVVLVVVPTVHRELDDLKSNGNERRARRAREAVGLLRRIVMEDVDEVVLREEGPRVVLKIPPDLSPQRERPEILDLTTADGRIVEEALACSNTFYAGKLTLLSNDGMPLKSAKSVGLSRQPVPEPWLAPREQSQVERENQELRRQLQQLQAASPRINASFLQGDTSVELATASYTYYPPLDEEFIARVLTGLRGALPRSDGRQSGLVTITLGLSLDNYSKRYEAWLQTVENNLRRFSFFLNSFEPAVPLALKLTNDGSRSAEGLVVHVLAEGRIHLLSPSRQEDLRRRWGEVFPKPPVLSNELSPLRIEELDTTGFAARHQQMMRNLPPLPSVGRGFRWAFSGSDLSTNAIEGECEEFRHGFQAELFPFGVRPETPGLGKTVAVIRTRTSVRNLPEVEQALLRVELTGVEGDTKARLRETVEADLGVKL